MAKRKSNIDPRSLPGVRPASEIAPPDPKPPPADEWLAVEQEIKDLSSEDPVPEYTPREEDEKRNLPMAVLWNTYPKLFGGLHRRQVENFWTGRFLDSKHPAGTWTTRDILDCVARIRRGEEVDPSAPPPMAGEETGGAEGKAKEEVHGTASKPDDHRRGTPETAETFSKNIRAALSLYPGNEQDVAMAAGVSRTLMSAWKTAKPGQSKVEKMTVQTVNFARVLGVDPASLWKEELRILGPVLVDVVLGRKQPIFDTTSTTFPVTEASQSVADKISRLMTTRDGFLAAGIVDSLYEKHFR